MPNFRFSACLLMVVSLADAQFYKDSTSGAEVLEFAPSDPQPTNLYFHSPNFTADNRLVIVAWSESGKAQISAYDVASPHINALTTGDGVSASTACPHPTKANLPTICGARASTSSSSRRRKAGSLERSHCRELAAHSSRRSRTMGSR